MRLSAMMLAIEDILGRIYDIPLGDRAVQFLLDEQSFLQLPQEIQNDIGRRAGVVILEETPPRYNEISPLLDNPNELHIGLYFSEQVRHRIITMKTLLMRDVYEIETVAIVVEELSHLHFILHRALNQKSCSKVEIEFQGEIDKFVVLSIFLREMHGIDVNGFLRNLLYENARIDGHHVQLYENASDYAHRFIRSLDKIGIKPFDSTRESGKFRDLLRKTYRMTWNEKKNFIDGVSSGALFAA